MHSGVEGVGAVGFRVFKFCQVLMQPSGVRAVSSVDGAQAAGCQYDRQREIARQ